MPSTIPWWRDAVVYEVYPRSFADSDGDGVGDLPGITSRLPYLADLGIDAIWLTPFYRSPQVDHGYDVADYRDVDPLFGTLADLDTLINTAHGFNIKVIVDVVPNHTSSQHEWFAEALASEPGSSARDRYVFRDGVGARGSSRPNNWHSNFGGPAWTRVRDAPDQPANGVATDDQWYLHLFDAGQPDLNWSNPEVAAEFESILAFWLDRGVDGFRVDVAHGLIKADGLPDRPRGGPDPYSDQPAVHDVYRGWRRVLDRYEGDRMAVAEAWSDDADLRSLYTRPDELHQAFNFHLQMARWSAATYRRVIDDGLVTTQDVGSSATWVLSSHDQVRHASRHADGALGLARARAATLLMLALPGSAYLWQGEELGLPQVYVAPEHRHDPAWERSGHREIGRDGCRVPIPWSGTAPPYGFGPGSGQPWLPQPSEWAELSVERQDADAQSTLAFYRSALRERRARIAGNESPLCWLASPPGTLAFTRGNFVSTTNFGTRPRRVAVTGTELISSGDAAVVDGTATRVPPATTVWLDLAG